MTQEDPVDAGRQHLLEHPGVRAHRRFVGAVDRNVDDHRRRPMSTLRRPALHQALHVVGETLHVERRMLHVVADVISVGLRVFDALRVAAFRTVVRTGVVNRLALFQELDGSVDPLRLVGDETRSAQKQ
jgi:hypothetical protein